MQNEINAAVDELQGELKEYMQQAGKEVLDAERDQRSC